MVVVVLDGGVHGGFCLGEDGPVKHEWRLHLSEEHWLIRDEVSVLIV
jgi:hypothetical protein